MVELSNLKHVEVPIKNGGFVYVLDKGEVINSEAEAMLQALHSRSVGGLKGHLEVLEEKGIKQVWLADKLGKSFNTVNGYVQNRNQPSLEVLYEIANILDVNPKELLIS